MNRLQRTRSSKQQTLDDDFDRRITDSHKRCGISPTVGFLAPIDPESRAADLTELISATFGPESQHMPPNSPNYALNRR